MSGPSRRSFLAATGAGVSSCVAGCLSVFSGNDERVSKSPPGSRSLQPAGSWPSFRYDAGNTGANTTGNGVRNATEYWRLNAGEAATVANGKVYNTFTRNQARSELTIRSPATAAVETNADLVEYAVNPPPVVDGGRVFLTTFIEVFCFDAASGERLWRGPEMNGINGRPIVSEGSVVVTGGGFDDVPPQTRAFDAPEGSELWRYNTRQEASGSPAVANGRAFISTVNRLHAIDLATGRKEYVVRENQPRFVTPVVDDGTVYTIAAANDGNELVALTANDGKERWRISLDTTTPPVVGDGIAYTRREDGVLGVDTDDGSVVQVNSTAANPVGLVGEVLYATERGSVYAFDTANGLQMLWSIDTEEVRVQDTIRHRVHHVAPVDGAVYVSASDAFHGIGPE